MSSLITSTVPGTRFFITLEPAAGWADGKYVAFGRVIRGMDTIQRLAALEVEPPSNYPKQPITIVDSGCYPRQT